MAKPPKQERPPGFDSVPNPEELRSLFWALVSLISGGFLIGLFVGWLIWG